MAVDYKPLRRNQEWGTDAKRAISKLFGLAEDAADPSTSSEISRKIVHKTLAGKVSAGEQQAFQTLFAGLRTAMDNDDTTYDIKTHVTSCRWDSARRTKIIKDMAQDVVDMISA